MPQVLHSLSSFLVYVGPLALIALKVGLIVGMIGSALELIGDFCQTLDRPRVVKFGAGLSNFGKMLEAWGSDVPKFVTNATGWVSKMAKLFGLAALFLFVCALQLGARV